MHLDNTQSRSSSVSRTIAIGLVALCATICGTASAQTAYLTHRVSLRAGPDFGYPQVAWYSGGTNVYVHGCTRSYHWCDVSVNGIHGWASARHLGFPHQNRRVVVYGNGLAFGAPVIGFAVGSYWDTHYRDRPWYHHHGYWSGWRPGVAARPEYYRAAPLYVAPRPVYVAPRPVYVHPHRADSHAHRAEQRALRNAQRREAQRVRHERHIHRHDDRRAAPPAVMGFTRP
jgi:uncharacterized protein YraI